MSAACFIRHQNDPHYCVELGVGGNAGTANWRDGWGDGRRSTVEGGMCNEGWGCLLLRSHLVRVGVQLCDEAISRVRRVFQFSRPESLQKPSVVFVL